MFIDEFSALRHDPQLDKSFNDFSDLSDLLSTMPLTESARRYQAPAGLRSAKNVSIDFLGSTNWRWQAENTKAISQLITFTQSHGGSRPHFRQLYRFAAFLRHGIAERMKHHSRSDENEFGIFRNGGDLFEPYAVEQEGGIVEKLHKAFKIKLQRLGREKFAELASDADGYSSFVKLIGAKDGRLMPGFNQPCILMKNTYRSDRHPKASRYLSQISFDDYTRGSHKMMHPTFTLDTLEADFEVMDELYQRCLECEHGENYETFLFNVGHLIHFLANICPVARGNSAIMGMLMQTIAAQRGIYLGGLSNKAGDELSFDYQAFYVANPDDYARWFVANAFDSSQICTLEAMHSRFALHDALLSCDENKVMEVLGQENIDVNLKDGYHRTPLHLAIQLGNRDAINCLLEKGASIISRDHQAKSCLDYAIQGGSPELVNQLINHDSSIILDSDSYRRPLLLDRVPIWRRLINITPRRPLQTAATSNQMDVFNDLLNRGISIEPSDTEWPYVVFEVAQNGHLDMLDRLLSLIEGDEKIPLDSLDIKKHHLLHAAAKHGRVEIINYLLGKGDEDFSVSSQDRDRQTPLHLAVIHGQIGAVRALLAKGANLDGVDEENIFYTGGMRKATPLDLAIIHGHLDIARLLIDQNAKPSFIDDDRFFLRRTYFHQAVIHGQLELLSKLLDKYPDQLTVEDGYRNTLLHSAAKHGQTEIIEELIERGLQVNKLNKIDMTPLYLAAQNAHIAAVTALLERGASASCPGKSYFRQPLHAAVTNSGQFEVARVLRDYGADFNITSPEEKITVYKNILRDSNAQLIPELFSLLDDMGIDCPGQTPLHLAAELRNGETTVRALLLLGNGSDVNAKDKGGNTPLHRAVQFQGTRTVLELLEYGADVNAKDEGGNTPLHRAVQFQGTRTVLELLEYGADVNVQNCKGATPLEVANIHSGEAAVLLSQYMNTLPNHPSRILFLAAIKQNETELVRQILGIKPGYLTIDETISSGVILSRYERRTALEVAAAHLSRLDTFRLLLELGADYSESTNVQLSKIIAKLPEPGRQSMRDALDYAVGGGAKPSDGSARDPLDNRRQTGWRLPWFLCCCGNIEPSQGPQREDPSQG